MSAGEIPLGVCGAMLDMKSALDLAVLFHETYERLAPDFGYETRPDTKVFDPESKNGRLMVAVCGEILNRREIPTPADSNG